jgi:hypothetical protein
MKKKLLLKIGLAAFLAIATASAQAGSGFRVNIPFSFVVKGAVLPAGDYEFLRGNGLEYVLVLSLTKGPSAGAVITERLSDPTYDIYRNCETVFDKVGDTYTLSEIWFPQMSGFRLYAAKEPSERKVVLNGRR